MFKRFGVVYCLLCGCETTEADGVCDDCLEGVDQELKTVIPLERELAIEDR